MGPLRGAAASATTGLEGEPPLPSLGGPLLPARAAPRENGRLSEAAGERVGGCTPCEQAVVGIGQRLNEIDNNGNMYIWIYVYRQKKLKLKKY